jgi:hypothetical protein
MTENVIRTAARTAKLKTSCYSFHEQLFYDVAVSKSELRGKLFMFNIFYGFYARSKEK